MMVVLAGVGGCWRMTSRSQRWEGWNKSFDNPPRPTFKTRRRYPPPIMCTSPSRKYSKNATEVKWTRNAFACKSRQAVYKKWYVSFCPLLPHLTLPLLTNIDWPTLRIVVKTDLFTTEIDVIISPSWRPPSNTTLDDPAKT